MQKYSLIGVSICAVVLLILASLSNVVGYQTIESSNQTTINNEIKPRALVFQTILDIANNKDMQSIILKYQVLRGEHPDTTIPVVTMKQLKQMYFVGLILTKIISTARIQSMIKQYQINNQGVQNEINTVIQKDTALNGKITQLSTSECGCENENTIQWNFTIICTLLFPIFMYALLLWALDHTIFLVFIIGDIGKTLNCWWSVLAP